jgi:hypothetical protein
MVLYVSEFVTNFQIRIIISDYRDFEEILSLLSQSFELYIVLNDTFIWQSRVRVLNATFNNISVISSLPLAICCTWIFVGVNCESDADNNRYSLDIL